MPDNRYPNPEYRSAPNVTRTQVNQPGLPRVQRGFSRWLPWLLLLIILLAGGYLGYRQYDKTKKLNQELADLKQNPQKVEEESTKELIDKVGQLVVLPSGEQPTIATVTDLEPLKDQPFFRNAKIGYKVLIYTNAKKAILYDPEANKVVEIAPLNIGNTAPSNTSSTP